MHGAIEDQYPGAMRTTTCVSRSHVRLWLGLLFILPCAVFALSHRYDAAGRLTWSVQPGGQATHFAYDPAGNITAIAVVTPAQDTDADGLPDTWEVRFGGDETGRSATADADRDGLIDLQEFAFARLPDRPDGGGITPVSIESTAGGARLTLRYLRPVQGTATLNYIAEISSDMKTWSAAASEVESLTPVDQGNGLEQVTVRAKAAPGSTSRLFLRIRIEKR